VVCFDLTCALHVFHSQVGVALYRITSGRGPWAEVKVFGKQVDEIVVKDVDDDIHDSH